MKRYRLSAWGVPAGAVLALLAGLALGRAAAQSQAEPAAGVKDPGSGKIYTSKTAFDLPVNIDERALPNVQKVVLFVKIGQGPWAEAQSVLPHQKKFHYQAPGDGEYWFSVVTVDRSGAVTPRDVSKEPPGLMVVVDTQPPTFELQPSTLTDGRPSLRCLLHDSNPDYQALKITYRGPDGTARALEPAPGQPGHFRIPGPELLNSWVRVLATDRCGNSVTRDINLKELTAQGSAPTPAQLAAQSVPAPSPVQQTSVTAPAPLPTPSRPVVHAGEVQTASKSAPADGLSLPTPQAAPANATAAAPPEPAQKPVTVSRPGTPPRQVLNTKHAAIEYRVDPVGPSGIGKVEVWMTADKGASWQRVSEDQDRRSPADLDLPGEGLFGVRLVVYNGNGFGGSPPGANDPPHTWIEVDTTPPAVHLSDIEPAARDGKLEIRWTVTDKNLAPEPIHLFYATKREGPWQPIARGVRNEGSYLWAFPHDAGNQFFVKLEVADQAGNRGEASTPMPVVLDMTEPHALVVGVTGVSAAPNR
jgi:hypothetical protein